MSKVIALVAAALVPAFAYGQPATAAASGAAAGASQPEMLPKSVVDLVLGVTQLALNRVDFIFNVIVALTGIVGVLLAFFEITTRRGMQKAREDASEVQRLVHSLNEKIGQLSKHADSFEVELDQLQKAKDKIEKDFEVDQRITLEAADYGIAFNALRSSWLVDLESVIREKSPATADAEIAEIRQVVKRQSVLAAFRSLDDIEKSAKELENARIVSWATAMRSQLHSYHGNVDEALRIAEADENPQDFGDRYYIVGYYHARQGNFERAKEEFSKAFTREPKLADYARSDLELRWLAFGGDKAKVAQLIEAAQKRAEAAQKSEPGRGSERAKP